MAVSCGGDSSTGSPATSYSLLDGAGKCWDIFMMVSGKNGVRSRCDVNSR